MQTDSENATSAPGPSIIPVTRSALPPELGGRNIPRTRVINGHDISALDAALDRARRLPVYSLSANAPAHPLPDPTLPEIPEVFGSPVPFVVDPLPMPLAAMIPACSTERGTGTPFRIVPKHASLAGR